MEILSDEEVGDIVSWLPHGRGFMIYQKKRFSTEIMAKYFKKSKFTSFTRKLNRWNFTRITRGPETGAYYHEFFQRGNLRLCMQMCCQNSKNAAAAQSSSAGGPRSDAMNRMLLGESDIMGGGGDMSAMGMLQNQLNAQLGAQQSFGGGEDDNMFQLRQLEHQRDLLLQQQQQQQQLAALGLQMGGSPGSGGNPDMSALQRGNANAYLTMLMAQEKMQAQMQAFGGGGQGNFKPQDKMQAQMAAFGGQGNFNQQMGIQRQQANMLHQQQQQLEQFSQQRILQAQAAMQLQQQDGSWQGSNSSGGNNSDNRGKIAKRGASAA